MFTGIIETQGTIESVSESGSGKTFWLSSPITRELKTDQSLAHNGVCLTVEEVRDDQYRVTAVHETLKKTNLGEWNLGDQVNLERCVPMNGRFDGHIVQGHVDTTAICTGLKEREGSWELKFEIPGKFAHLIIEKGSVCLNGISLTVFRVKEKSFSVAVIPYTFKYTNIRHILPGSTVNIEFDVIGKYVQRMMGLKKP